MNKQLTEVEKRITPQVFKSMGEVFFKQLEIIREEAGEFLLNPEAEDSLVLLKEYGKAIEELEDFVKGIIRERGEELGGGLKSISGEKIRVFSRKYGEKYKFVLNKRDELEPFLKKKEWWNVDTDKVEAYVKEVGELPDGVYESDREEQISISLKGGGDED